MSSLAKVLEGVSSRLGTLESKVDKLLNAPR